MQIAAYIKSFLVLFVVVTVILQLIPGTQLKKYIYFFAQFVLVIGILHPLLSFFWDTDVFLEQIEYEAFSESLAETARGARRIAEGQKEDYLKKYESIVAQDVARVAEEYGQAHGYAVKTAQVRLNSSYEIETVEVEIEDREETEICVDEISIGEERQQGNELLCQNVKEKLESYYQLEEGSVNVCYTGSD